MLLVLVRDLLLASRITSTAQGLRLPFKVIRNPENLAAESGRSVILDLEQPDTLQAAIDWKARSGGRLIGFGSHVNVVTMKQAQDAGVDRVFARSALMTALPELLKELTEELP